MSSGLRRTPSSIGRGYELFTARRPLAARWSVGKEYDLGILNQLLTVARGVPEYVPDHMEHPIYGVFEAVESLDGLRLSGGRPMRPMVGRGVDFRMAEADVTPQTLSGPEACTACFAWVHNYTSLLI